MLIPSAFAYSILHDQLWGIRRLIHRGLVYALVSASVLAFVMGGIALVNEVFGGTHHTLNETFAISVVAFTGIMAYRPLGWSARWLVDRLVYGSTPSYPEFVHGLQRNIASADPESELPDTLNHVLADHLDLESALLFKHDDSGELELLSEVGGRTGRVLQALRSKRIALPSDVGQDTPVVIPFEGEQILAMQLWAAQEHVGTIMLGPKMGGELFIQEEVNLIANSAPFLGAALERHEMSQTMRQLNKRLIETDELSRQRMAVDLHDGPLQKAVALAIGRVTDPSEQREVASELVNELRELGSRLRPSILDDLGLPSSIEWLLEHNMRGTEIEGSLDLDDVDPDDRFHPDVELALFRVTQEAINNAVKHSSATELRVHIEQDEGHLVLTIKDNGVGIGGAGSGRIPSSRLGMIGMRERVIQVGGHLEVHSWPGRGVFIQATVPATPRPVLAPAQTMEE
jgi:signal transduction histidine kinase